MYYNKSWDRGLILFEIVWFYNMEKLKCYIYTRVSTTMQVEGYSIAAQRENLLKNADAKNMIVVGEYSDEGKSGKNIEGRPQFSQMLEDIENKKDGVSFVLVYKLSRFGRNAADVLNTVEFMQSYGVNLICTDDSIDSSKDGGKLLISILSSVAEIERENIRAQTMAGREQKAREGRWNGGFAPYGYRLEKGELVIVEEEAEQVRLIFDKFVHTTLGANGVATWLNLNGYKKIVRHNGKTPFFNPSFIKRILDGEVYYGKISYGKRKTTKIEGTRNQTHMVRQKEYPVYDGIHDAIVSEDLWMAAHEKRIDTGHKYEKKHSLDHEHLLSGVVKCPECGAGMYGNVNRKKKKNQASGKIEYYADYFYYQCKHRTVVDGRRCEYNRQIAEYKIDHAVEEIISELINNKQFEEIIKSKIDEQIDTSAMDTELANIKKKIKNLEYSKTRLAEEIDNLDVDDTMYEVKYQDMTNRMYRLYDDIELYEGKRKETETKILNIREEKIKSEQVYSFLACFDKLYDKFSDLEKKIFLKSFVDSIEIFPEEQPDGRNIKSIKFNFPVFYKGKEILGMSWDKKQQGETVCKLSKRIGE